MAVDDDAAIEDPEAVSKLGFRVSGLGFRVAFHILVAVTLLGWGGQIATGSPHLTVDGGVCRKLVLPHWLLFSF